MAYVYRHIRLDKNIPFYIGIGSDQNYKRATNMKQRNPHWRNIVNKSKIEVEIMLDGLSWDEACKKEIEFIELYGRTKDGGVLTNLTLGGDGQLGMTGELSPSWGKSASAATRQKMREKKLGKIGPRKGKPMPKHVREALTRSIKGKPAWNRGKHHTKEWVENWK